MSCKVGKVKSGQTIHREMRRTLNKYNEVIAEKLLAQALSGDLNALIACGQMLVEANRNPPILRRNRNKNSTPVARGTSSPVTEP